MKKNISILAFLIILPQVLITLYDRSFSMAGNILEDYANPVKLSLLIVSVLGGAYLVVNSYRSQTLKYKKIWVISGIIMTALLLIYLYLAINIINFSI